MYSKIKNYESESDFEKRKQIAKPITDKLTKSILKLIKECK